MRNHLPDKRLLEAKRPWEKRYGILKKLPEPELRHKTFYYNRKKYGNND